MGTTFRQMFIVDKTTFRRGVSGNMYLMELGSFDLKPFGYKFVQTGQFFPVLSKIREQLVSGRFESDFAIKFFLITFYFHLFRSIKNVFIICRTEKFQFCHRYIRFIYAFATFCTSVYLFTEREMSRRHPAFKRYCFLKGSPGLLKAAEFVNFLYGR